MIKKIIIDFCIAIWTLASILLLVLVVGYKSNFENKYTGSLLFWLVGILILIIYLIVMRFIWEKSQEDSIE